MSRAVQGHPRWTGHSGGFKSVSRKGSQPWIFIGRTDAKAEAEASILWLPDEKNDSLAKTLMPGKIEGRRRGQERISWFYGITDSMDVSLSKLWEMVKDREARCGAVHMVTKTHSWLSHWTITRKPRIYGIRRHTPGKCHDIPLISWI